MDEAASPRVGFFLFWFLPVQKAWVGWLLNVLLFLPFGFVLAWWSRVRGWNWLSRPLAISAAGFLFSYVVEFLQLFVVRRGSSGDRVLLEPVRALIRWAPGQCGGGRLRRAR